MAKSAMQALPKAQQQWVSKLASKKFPYGKNMKCWKLQTQAKCPHCSCLEKDKEQIFRCPVESTVTQWSKALTELEHWMVVGKIPP